MMRTPSIITGPLHAHGARSPEEYLLMQARHVDQLRRAYPQHGWREPWTYVGEVVAWISGGRWVITCECGNAPSASVDWNLAACFECGAIYRDVKFPDDRERLEQLLLARPNRQNRHWLPRETAADLADENRRHGHEARD